ncbi:MAG: hypothetical protein Q8P88_00475 [Candidatus Jorgensenbacteria bacterium]|nr:hypothetical protein [Candidatus Jorgensenbacteria bacterium]
MKSATILTHESSLKSPFTKQELAHFSALLIHEENDQIELQSEAQKKLKSKEEMGAGDHMERADQAIQDEALIDLDRAVNELGKIGRAKMRVKSGTYGVCMKSKCSGNGVIERERLEAVPHAEWCAKDARCGPPQR